MRQEEATLEEAELEQKSLEAKRNALNDERKELWRAENEAENRHRQDPRQQAEGREEGKALCASPCEAPRLRHRASRLQLGHMASILAISASTPPHEGGGVGLNQRARR